MARLFLSFALALAIEATIMLAVGAMPASAQPMIPAAPAVAPKPQKTYPDEVKAIKEAFKAYVNRPNKPAPISGPSIARKYPELPASYVMMYHFFNSPEVNQPRMARSQLEMGIRANPTDPEPWIILGNIAIKERRIAEATRDFEKAQQLLAKYNYVLRKNELQEEAMSGIAQLAENREDWKEAEARLRELVNLAPEDVAARERLAHSLFWQTKANEAYEVLKEAKEIDRKNSEKNGTREGMMAPEAIMAQFYEGTEFNRHGTSERWFMAALKKWPNDLPTREVVVNWALENGKLAFAKGQADAALQIEASDPKKYSGSSVGRMLRGLVALWEKDWPAAESYFEKIIQENPNDFIARNNLALALDEQNDLAKKQRALEYAKANYHDNNNRPEALGTLGWVYFRRGEFDQAELALNQAIKATGGQITNADTATYVAHILYHRDKKWQAKEILDNVLRNQSPFSMRPEAQKLWEKVKDIKNLTATPAETKP